MSVVFDEVVADVESAATPQPAESKTEEKPKDRGDGMRRELRRLSRREARLRAD